MEFFLLLICVLLVILVSTLLSRVGEVQGKVDDLKRELFEISAHVKAAAKRERAERLREVDEDSEENKRPVPSLRRKFHQCSFLSRR